MNARDAAINSAWILDRDVVSSRVISKCDFKARPRLRYAGVDDEGRAPQTKAEDPFKSGAIHPSGRTGVPSPSAPPNMKRLRVNIGAGDVRFDLVAKNVGTRSRMIDRIQNGEQFARLVSVSQHRECDHRPNG